MVDISKTSAINSTLQTIQKVTKLASQAQEHLATGKKVNKVTDDPFAFFVAKSLSDRASDLGGLKDGVDQSISSIRTAQAGIESVEDFTQQLKGLAEAAKSASPAEQQALSRQFEELGKQIANVVQDTSYQGQNLLTGSNTQETSFDTRAESKLEVNGLDLDATSFNAETSVFSANAFSGGGGFSLEAFGVAGGSFTSASVDDINNVIRQLDAGVDRLRGQASSLGNNVAILQERLDFTQEQVNIQQEGADKLVLADLNEEAAISVAAQTRNQIGVNSLSIAGNQQGAILELLS